MAEPTTTEPMDGSKTTQTGAADPSGSGTQPKTFTQEQVDNIVKERLARAKATPPADYDELKAKAAKYDQLEEANKSDLEKANEAKTRAEAEAADWKAKFEQLQEQRQRELDVRKAAVEYGVNADLLMRMSGDVEDNAKFLQSQEAARPKFGSMRDGGEQAQPAQTLDEALKDVKGTSERIRIRAEYNARNRK